MADTLQSLGKRLESTRDLHAVVKTMKAMAAVNIRQYEAAVESLADYTRTVEAGLMAFLRHYPKLALQASEAPALPLAAVVFGSDQGMCGQLNDTIVQHALKELEETCKACPKDRVILAFGERAANRLVEQGVIVAQIRRMPDSAAGIALSVQDLLVEIGKRGEQGIRRVVLFYTVHESAAIHSPETRVLLPLDRIWLDRLSARSWPTNQIPGFRGSAGGLFSSLTSQYLFSSLYQAFAESLASENASRLSSMQNAEQNIEKQIAELESRFHQKRQMAITEELLDIASGFEALRK